MIIKDKKLHRQILPVLIISTVLAAIIFGTIMYVSAWRTLLNEKEQRARNLAHTACDEILNTANYAWLLDYWQDNYEDMDITWDDNDHLTALRKEFVTLNPGLDIDTLSEEELLSLDADSQKLYAEISYMQIIMKFDRLKETFSPKYLYCFTVVGDERLYLITAKKSDETRGTGEKDIYILGHTDSLSWDDHPVLKTTYESGSEQTDFEQTKNSDQKRIQRYTIYIPITVNNETRAVVAVTLDAEAMHDEIVSHVMIFELITVAIFTIVFAVLALFLRRKVTDPLEQMQYAVSRFNYGTGSDDFALYDSDRLSDDLSGLVDYDSSSGRNEIENLAYEIQTMGDDLRKNINEVKEYSVRQGLIQAELDYATRIQNASLPKSFDVFSDRGINVYASTTPAKYVGGDFYNFFMADKDTAVFMIADVSGKGIPAALFMMASNNLIVEAFETEHSPSKILARVNNKLCGHNEADMFVTVWLGVLDLNTGILTATNAGHEKPIIRTAEHKYELFNDVHNFVVGGMEDLNYKEYTFQFKPGDRMFLYTDGIPEAVNSSDEQYGIARLIDVLNSAETNDPSAINDMVREDIKKFVGDAEQFDDITLLSIVYE